MKKTAEIELVLPEHQQNNQKRFFRVLGYLFRAALALLCTYSLTSFIFDCLGIDFSHGALFLSSALACAIFAFILSSPRLFIGGAVGLASLVVLFIRLHGKFFEVIRLTAQNIYNVCCERLAELGYSVAAGAAVDLSGRLVELGLDEGVLTRLAILLIVFLFAAICSLCLVRRTHVLVLIQLYTVVSVLMLCFGLCEESGGLLFMLATLCGVLTLSLYDNVYCKKKHIRALLGSVRESPDSRRELDYTVSVNSNLGGFAGIAATLIALAIAFVPMQISEPMGDIPLLSNAIVRIEDFIDSLTRTNAFDGASIRFGDGDAGQVRETFAQNRIYSGHRIFKIGSDLKIPIYLRSWVGTDYTSDGWHCAADERIDEYRERFGGGFSHEFLSAELLRAVDPSLVMPPSEGEDIVDHSSLGYVTAYVHIDKKSPTMSLLYMPSYTDQQTRLLRYGSRTDAHSDKYSNYYDGIFSSADYLFTNDYTVLAHLQLLPSEKTILAVGALVGEYADQHDILRQMRALISSGASDRDVEALYDSYAAARENVPSEYGFEREEGSLSYRYAYTMSRDERIEVDALTDNLSLYVDFVYDSYLTGCEGFGDFEELVRQICEMSDDELSRSAQSYKGRHEIAVAVQECLAQSMTYTLTPASPSAERPYVNAAETFLFDTHEGYCVQYATAMVMLLRAAGIPARYAEGYLAHDFSAAPEGGAAKYEATVRDSNAHAWVEVYYDYYGWVTYEATSSYISEDAYDGVITPTDTQAEDTTDTSDTTDTDTTSPDTTAPVNDVTTDGEDTGKADKQKDGAARRNVAFGVVIGVGVIAALAVLSILILHRAKEAEQRVVRMLEVLRAEQAEAQAHRDAALYLGDEIMRLLAWRSLVPQKGERASVFAARVDDAVGKLGGCAFADALRVIQKAEFANKTAHDEGMLLAEYHAALHKAVYQSAHPVKRILMKVSFLCK